MRSCTPQKQPPASTARSVDSDIFCILARLFDQYQDKRNLGRPPRWSVHFKYVRGGALDCPMKSRLRQLICHGQSLTSNRGPAPPSIASSLSFVFTPPPAEN